MHDCYCGLPIVEIYEDRLYMIAITESDFIFEKLGIVWL